MSVVLKVLKYLFTDQVDGTVSQSKLAAIAGAILFFINKKFGESLPIWITEYVTADTIQAFLASILVAWFGIANKNAISKSSVQSPGDAGIPKTNG